MSSAGISFGGLGSGLDTQAIISALMAVERRPITALERKKSSFQDQKGLFGDLKGLLDKLEDVSRKLSRSQDLLSMTASSSNEDILTASAGNTATPGSHQIVVKDLAQAKIAAAGRADLTETYSGTVFLEVDGVLRGIDVNGDLNSVAAAINAETDALGVSADVVDTGIVGPEQYKLVVRSSEVGSDNAYTLTFDSGNAALDSLVTDINNGVISAGQNALISYNGVDISRPTNSIGDVIPGVTLDLKSADLNTTVTVTISTDAEETAETVQEFVDAYNEIVDFVSGQNVVNDEGQTSNPLFGDPTLRSIRSNLRSIVGGSVDTGNQSFAMLAQIGIESDRDGKLTFNKSEFEEALASDEQAVASLFSLEGAGIANRVQDQIDVYTDSVDGLIKTRQDGFDRLIKDITRQIERSEDRLERTEAGLKQKFANLEGLLARLQGQGNSLSTFSMGQSQ